MLPKAGFTTIALHVAILTLKSSTKLMAMVPNIIDVIACMFYMGE
jgi:hypothetical protein